LTDPTTEFFGRLAQRGHEPMLEAAQGTFRFELADGKRVERWYLTVEKGDIAVSHKNAAADCTVRADKALFDGVASGEVNAVAAVLRGAVKLEGDWELMVSLQRLFPPRPKRRSQRQSRRNGSTKR
jgi:putative sterol carrier protein